MMARERPLIGFIRRAPWVIIGVIVLQNSNAACGPRVLDLLMDLVGSGGVIDCSVGGLLILLVLRMCDHGL